MIGMIDHVSIGVSDLGRSRAFYDAALAPLGYRRRFDLTEASGYDRQGVGPLAFWIGCEPEARPSAGTHICFAAPSRAAVDAFHAAALAAGGRDNGRPGLRPQYHANYYAAFVFDPDGHKVEAVRHDAE